MESLAAEAWQESGIGHWISEITSASFSKAIGGDGTRAVRHVQADDHLEGEQSLETVYRQGWVTAARRSYITDLAFAKERIGRMMASRAMPSEPPPSFALADLSGVQRFARALQCGVLACQSGL